MTLRPPRFAHRPKTTPADAGDAPPVGVAVSGLVAAAVSGTHVWVVSAVDVTAWPDAALVLLLAAPMLLALAFRTWFTVTHLHWWAVVLGATVLSVVPPLTLACGTSWVLFHTVRQARRPAPGLQVVAGWPWPGPVRRWFTRCLDLGRAFLADTAEPAGHSTGDVR